MTFQTSLSSDNLNIKQSALSHIDEAYKRTYLELMNLPDQYDFKTLRFAFTYISKKYHKYVLDQEKSFFESAYYALVTEAYDNLRQMLKQKILNQNSPQNTEIEFKEDTYVMTYARKEAEILAKLKQMYKDLCVNNPTTAVKKEDLKKKYLLETINQQKKYPGLKQFYREIYHNERLEEAYIKEKLFKPPSVQYTREQFKEALKDSKNTYFRIDLKLHELLPVLLGDKLFHEQDLNYEYATKVKKEFLCSKCAYNRNLSCVSCKGAKKYEKVIEVYNAESLTLKITADQIQKGFLVVPNKGHNLTNYRGLLLLDFNLNFKTYGERILIKREHLQIIKTLPLNTFNRTLNNCDNMEIPLHCLNQTINLKRFEICTIPSKHDITNQIAQITAKKKNLKVDLVLTLSIPT